MKCIKCGFPILRGMKYLTLEKGGRLAYMCLDCYNEETEETGK